MTKEQSIAYEDMMEAVENKKILLLPLNMFPKCMMDYNEKEVMNELGLTLQALGYEVILISDNENIEIYASIILNHKENTLDTNDAKKSVFIADEANYKEIVLLVEYCMCKRIPVVGYVNF